MSFFRQFFARSLELLTNEVDLDGPRVTCDDPEQPYGMGKKLVESMRQVSEIIWIEGNGSNGTFFILNRLYQAF